MNNYFFRSKIYIIIFFLFVSKLVFPAYGKNIHEILKSVSKRKPIIHDVSKNDSRFVFIKPKKTEVFPCFKHDDKITLLVTAFWVPGENKILAEYWDREGAGENKDTKIIVEYDINKNDRKILIEETGPFYKIEPLNFTDNTYTIFKRFLKYRAGQIKRKNKVEKINVLTGQKKESYVKEKRKMGNFEKVIMSMAQGNMTLDVKVTEHKRARKTKIIVKDNKGNKKNILNFGNHARFLPGKNNIIFRFEMEDDSYIGFYDFHDKNNNIKILPYEYLSKNIDLYSVEINSINSQRTKLLVIGWDGNETKRLGWVEFNESIY